MNKKAISTLAVVGIIIILIVIGVAAYYAYESSKGTSTTTTTTAITQTNTSASGVTLTILTRHPSVITDLARSTFLNSSIAKQYNIVDLQFLSVPENLWASTATAKNVDVGWGGGPTLFDSMYSYNLLAPLNTTIALNAASQIPNSIAGVPMKRVDSNGNIYWIAAAISSFGFTVNTQLAKQYGLPIPQSWQDLASLNFARVYAETGNAPLAMADPTVSTSNARIYEIILTKYGWDQGWKLLTLMAANAYISSSGSASSDVRDSVIRGERVVGITIDFYGYIAQYQNPSCVYIAPANETIINGDPIALFATSKHPTEAQAFIAWVLTDGQQIWLNPNVNRLPANPAVFNTSAGQARQDLYKVYQSILHTQSINFNDSLVLSYENVTLSYFKAVLVNPNQALQQAWLALVNAYINGRINITTFMNLENQLTSPIVFTDPITGNQTTFTMNEAIQLNSAVQSGKVDINSLMNTWTNLATQKYTNVLQEVRQLGG
ncbi:ABC transporter substrate-binding protein [Fervidicoccus fontis]|uniref:ABC transporter substrate-binding protein n=1 Tax=Fervidicoccus fontis TaxID=683846 RepID=A0A7C2VR73_9CREN|nr:ABC transporter substrate-binding protein [Fervidicoccus fontis]PMB76289.1 MAG: ABC transporter substrate-binding protein [Fervidicoccus fontis]HEW64362.1 ABC transporter substrate-binding protein [Fervidicoccus fontis]